jgi:hypothetical protein
MAPVHRAEVPPAMDHAELHTIWAYLTFCVSMNLQKLDQSGNHYPGCFDMAIFLGEWEPLKGVANMNLKMQHMSKKIRSIL